MIATEIFCDVDGVLADFYYASIEAHGGNGDGFPPNEWNIPMMLGITEEEFWEPIDNYEFWRNLPAYNWAQELVSTLREYGNVTFASVPSHNPDCHKAKVEWIRERFGEDSPIILGAKKRLLAQKWRVLVDDRVPSCTEFNAYGGTGIVFPQRWNNGYLYLGDKVKYVTDQLKARGYSKVKGA